MSQSEPHKIVIAQEMRTGPEFYYSITGVAEKLGVSRSTVTTWKREGKLPEPVLINGIQRYRETDIEHMVASQNPGLVKDRLSGDIEHFINNQGA